LDVKINYDIPETFNIASVLVDRHVEEGRGDRVAFYCGDQTVTFAELQHRVNKVGNMLRARGIGVEDRVAILTADRIEFVETYLGAMKIGAIPLPLNTLLKPEDDEAPGAALPYYLLDSRARAIVVDADLAAKLEPARSRSRFLRHVFARGGRLADCLSYELELAESSDQLEAEPTSKDDSSYWQYSSGTTGQPKGVVHGHADMVSCIASWLENVSDPGPDDVVYSTTKLFASYGLSSALYQPLFSGTAGVLTPEPPTPQLVADTLRRYWPTVFFSTPALYKNMLLEHESGKLDLDTSSLRICVSAGEALPDVIFERWQRTFGLEILDGIGSTENGYIYIQNLPGRARRGSSGQILPGYEARILDQDEVPLADGEVGELFLKSASAAGYYWNKREKSRDTFRGPWLKTGDLFVLDADGYYYYQGRADDMFKAFGNWVSPIEVESALLRHTAVADAAVIGCDDENGLVRARGFIVLKAGQQASETLAQALIQHCHDELKPNHYKAPKWISFVGELPKTAGGKIQRFKLRQEA
jgi:benzoate-CoA ligase